MKQQTEKFRQQRRFIMVLPMLVLPFLTAIFWALGGGQAPTVTAAPVATSGLMTEVPESQFKDEQWNKLSLYEKAQRDSLRSREAREHDPYFDLATLVNETLQEQSQSEVEKEKINTSVAREKALGASKDPNELKVNKKLDELIRELNKGSESKIRSVETEASEKGDVKFSSDVDKLEQMMELMQDGKRSDPEMEKIGGMLDKILDIQHPDRVKEKYAGKGPDSKAFSVTESVEKDNIGMLSGKKATSSLTMDSTSLVSNVFQVQAVTTGFYGLESEIQSQNEVPNSIQAVVHDTQELVAGSVVKMRLLSDVTINGSVVSAGQLVFGTCSINGERLTIKITSIRDENSLLPVNLSVFDLDGLEGLYIPGAITRDAAKQSSDQAMQSMQFMTMDQSISAQAASAGMQAAKGLFSKKVKLIKVTVKAGYQILLKDGNSKI